uniref:Uncharacterized protein n=1 Tax=Anguilla anguilla TaxID=7936 RepID=A0A0E9SFR9_ANGAN
MGDAAVRTVSHQNVVQRRFHKLLWGERDHVRFMKVGHRRGNPERYHCLNYDSFRFILCLKRSREPFNKKLGGAVHGVEWARDPRHARGHVENEPLPPFFHPRQNYSAHLH